MPDESLEIFNDGVEKFATVHSFHSYIDVVFCMSRKGLQKIPYLYYKINDSEILTLENISEFRESFLGSSKFNSKILVCGNFVPDEARDIFDMVISILKNDLTEELYEKFPDSQVILELKTQLLCCHPFSDSTHIGVCVYFQCLFDKSSRRNIVLLHLYKQIYSLFFFCSLRNDQQLAYSLLMQLETRRNFAGIYFLLETKSHTADQAEKSLFGIYQRKNISRCVKIQP